MSKHEFEPLLDGLGDCLVVCTILRKQLGLGQLFSTIHYDYSGFACGAAAQIVQANIDLGNVASGLAKGKSGSDFEDSLSGFENQLRIIADFLGTTPQIVLRFAWNAIKDRTGKMVDGVFVKEADLPK